MAHHTRREARGWIIVSWIGVVVFVVLALAALVIACVVVSDKEAWLSKEMNREREFLALLFALGAMGASSAAGVIATLTLMEIKRGQDERENPR